MAKIGIFYGSSTGHTEKVADLIRQEFGDDAISISVEDATIKDVKKFSYLIFGTPTWEIGEMQEDWEDFMAELDEVDLKTKKVALFGLGDQEVYEDSFVDGLGKLYQHIKDKAKVVGFWPTEGYLFSKSEAEVDGKFAGLVIDEDNQPKLTSERIQKWVKLLKKEFK